MEYCRRVLEHSHRILAHENFDCNICIEETEKSRSQNDGTYHDKSLTDFDKRKLLDYFIIPKNECWMCNVHFDDIDGQLEHFRNNHECDHCNRLELLPSLQERRKHILFLHNACKYCGFIPARFAKDEDSHTCSRQKCFFCGIVYESVEKCFDHFSTFHCTICSWMTFPSTKDKRNHTIDNHIFCKFCGEEFLIKSLKLSHESCHDQTSIKRCWLCKSSFCEIEEAEKHFSDYHCDHCRLKKFKSPEEKRDHFIDQHECSYCQEEFEHKFLKTWHEDKHKKEKMSLNLN